MSSGHHERGFLDPRHPGQTRVMFQVSTARRPVHTLTTTEGLLPSFRYGLHGGVGVVFGYIEGSFLVSRTACARERHVPCIEGPFLVSKTGHVRERHAP
jgi:hypothetical protein